MEQPPRDSMTDRERLVLLMDQMRRMETTIDRLAISIESRLAQGDRRFAEVDTRLTGHDTRHTSANNAINALDGRVIDLGRALGSEVTIRKGLEDRHNAQVQALEDKHSARIQALEDKLETQANEFSTWKTRAQTVSALLGFAWAFVTFVWPFLPTFIRIVNGGTP